MNNEIITLIVEIFSSNERAFAEPDEMRFEGIFARMDDAKRTEFYAAASANVRVSKTATINSEDWKHCNMYSEGRYIYPSKVEHAGTTYEIVRHYEADEFTTQLTLKEVE